MLNMVRMWSDGAKYGRFMSGMPIRILASHAWGFTEHTAELMAWLESPLQGPAGSGAHAPVRASCAPRPPHKFETRAMAAYDADLATRIGQVDLLVAPVGMYSAHSRWITREISLARRAKAPILAVNPWGPLRAPSVVAASASLTVGWSREAVRAAVWRLSEGSTARVARRSA